MNRGFRPATSHASRCMHDTSTSITLLGQEPEMGPGHVLSVLKFPSGPAYTDYTTGQVGALFPSSEDTFFAGPSFRVPVPIAIHGRLSTDPVKKLIALH